MALVLTLTAEHGYLLLSLGAIAFECVLIGIVVVGGARRKIFTQQFMENHFGEAHSKHYKEPINPEGYPDMGTGRYSEKLSYNDWVYFNNAQRAHYNLVEQVASVLALLAIGGISYPVPAAIFGWIYFVARLFYCWYVSSQGAKHPLRRVGAFLGDIALVGGFVLTIMTAVKVIGYEDSKA